MKHFYTKTLTAIFALAMVSANLSAHDFVANGIYYNRISGTTDAVEVTYGYSSSNGGTYTGSVVIPSTVTYDGTDYRVTAIADRAFFNGVRQEGISSVVIPDGVTSIGQYAFEYCTNLTTVNIPGSVTTIGDWAFADCGGLTTVTMGEGVTKIGGCAFDYCSSLTEADIPESVTTIGNSAFRGCQLKSVHLSKHVTSLGVTPFACKSLTAITVDEDNPLFDSRSDCNAIIETATNTLLVGCAGTVIPQGVTTIGNQAFASSGITTLRIPGGVTTIEQYAFSRSSLQSLAIPSSVTAIGNSAFYNVTTLRNVTVNQATPLALSTMSNPFSGLNLSSATLYVPQEGLVAYQTADCWKTFDTFKTYTELVDATLELTFKDGDEYEYQGTPIYPEVASLKLNGEEWEDFGVYLECTYSNNVNVGNGLVTIKERYNNLPFNRAVVSFTIVPKQIGYDDVEITGAAQTADEGETPDLSGIKIVCQGTELQVGKDYEVSVDDTVFQIVITFKGNYSGEITLPYGITTGIGSLTRHRGAAEYYDIRGIRTSQLTRGLYIVRTADGHSKVVASSSR